MKKYINVLVGFDNKWIEIEPSYLRSVLKIKLGKYQIYVPLTLEQLLASACNVYYNKYDCMNLKIFGFGPFQIRQRNK